MIRSLFAVAALFIVGAQTASAQPLETSQQAILVHSSDTASSFAVRSLLGRLAQASLDVCGAPSGSDRHYIETVRHTECFTSALGGAVAAAHSAALDRAYAIEQHLKPVDVAAR